MRRDHPTIALLSDFGLTDWYVASMKAVIARGNPAARIIDISHQIEPGNVHAGAFVLSQCYDDFPKGTVFVCVVDPGVGGPRKPIILYTGDYTFVAPDNGILSLLKPCMRRAFEIDVASLDPTLKRSYTFHGRDVFAPVAALLSNGVRPLELGTPVDAIAHLGFEFTVVKHLPQGGQFIYFDHFGNAISNLQLSRSGPFPGLLALENGPLVPFRRSYSEAPENEPVAYVGSGGFVELAINRGSARTALRLEEENAFTVQL